MIRSEVSGWTSSITNGAPSIRKPLTPSSSQNETTRPISSRTSGLFQLRSGWKS